MMYEVNLNNKFKFKANGYFLDMMEKFIEDYKSGELDKCHYSDFYTDYDEIFDTVFRDRQGDKEYKDNLDPFNIGSEKYYSDLYTNLTSEFKELIIEEIIEDENSQTQ